MPPPPRGVDSSVLRLTARTHPGRRGLCAGVALALLATVRAKSNPGRWALENKERGFHPRRRHTVNHDDVNTALLAILVLTQIFACFASGS